MGPALFHNYAQWEVVGPCASLYTKCISHLRLSPCFWTSVCKLRENNGFETDHPQSLIWKNVFCTLCKTKLSHQLWFCLCRDLCQSVSAFMCLTNHMWLLMCDFVFTKFYMCLPMLPNYLIFAEMFANLAITRSLSLSSQAQAAIKWVINAKSRMRRC